MTPRSKRAADDVDPVGFDDVVGLDVVEVADLDAAFEVLWDFLGVVLEPFEGFDRSFIDLASLTDQPDFGRAFDDALSYKATGDRTNLGDLEDLAHHGTAEMDFLDLRDEHPLDGLLDVVGHLVNDI